MLPLKLVNVTGFTPDNLNYCPECGADGFPHKIYRDDMTMKCDGCGLRVYIIEAEDSHSLKGEK